MANMSYCRFENTFMALDDCFTALGEKELRELSETEREFAIKLIKMCKNISEIYIEEVEEYTKNHEK